MHSVLVVLSHFIDCTPRRNVFKVPFHDAPGAVPSCPSDAPPPNAKKQSAMIGTAYSSVRTTPHSLLTPSCTLTQPRFCTTHTLRLLVASSPWPRRRSSHLSFLTPYKRSFGFVLPPAVRARLPRRLAALLIDVRRCGRRRWPGFLPSLASTRPAAR